ncbi:MAG: hypothetical protein GC203_01500 [Phenylobacterium sp.]|uniref:HEPN domain-containing protein n=1 Tax=Phenylobacterium sp. TaxID=1871053 RepID=UPI0025EFE69D|nr:HEPN domain-containing protein [Phenylobacterium sp.]MBI1196519.1 hypothetical protein [Phenylobacterium sp.]
MSKLGDAKSIANHYIDEISSMIEIRAAYSNIVVGRAGQLFQTFKDDERAKGALEIALRHKTVDAAAFYRPLIVQLNGVFERYIRDLVRAVIEDRFETAKSYQALKRTFRNSHVYHASRILYYIKTGSIMGSAYNFDSLLDNLGINLSGSAPIKLNAEIYTKIMGNCTSDRLKSLFVDLELPDPFGDRLGKNAQLKAYFADKAKGRVAERASEELDRQIDLRNNIVHGEMTLSVDLAQLNDSLAYFRALIDGLDELVRV